MDSERNARPDTRVLADWMAGLRLEDVPPDVVDKAKDCLLDNLGCVIAGTAARPCVTMLDVLARHASGDITVPGTGRRLSVLGAAYVNAQAANAFDFDDSYRSGAPSHPGATVIPPALAMAELKGAGGAALLRAVILGYEVSLRVGRAVQPSPERKAKVYGFSTWQVFGAAAVSGALLGLDGEGMANALGLAAVHAPVPSLRKLGTEDPLPYPWIKNTYGAASEAGVLAALLAADGYIGSRNVFDGDGGFWLMAGSDRYDPLKLTESLGQVWLLRDVGFKTYGCCRWTHTMLDALRELKEGLDPAAIDSVEVHGFDELSRLGGAAPTSVIDAQFHAQHLAALELLGRSPASGLAEADLDDARVATLRGKVHLHHDPAADEPFYRTGVLPVRVRITLADSQRRECTRRDPSGSAAAGGLTDAELRRKFLRLTTPRLGHQRAESVMAMVRELERHTAASLAGLVA
jgi:2-methylcitrate dehydratase PrpD